MHLLSFVVTYLSCQRNETPLLVKLCPRFVSCMMGELKGAKTHCQVYGEAMIDSVVRWVYLLVAKMCSDKWNR